MVENDVASPICRGKNLSWETVMLFFNYMPKVSMPKSQFNSFVEKNINGWTQTHSQIARQLAFYYEKDGICYPRFGELSTLSDVFEYLVHWAHNYFVPNPFTPSLKGNTPRSIYSHLVECIRNGNNEFDSALDSLFNFPLSSHDKVRVYLQNYTNIRFDSGRICLNDSLADEADIKNPTELAATNSIDYFYFYGNIDSGLNQTSKLVFSHYPLQQIFYGAPGTGKSKTVNDTTEKMPDENVFRITFHPDSDYASFVGCYKPKKISAQKIVSVTELKTKFKEYYTREGYKNCNLVQFGYDHAESLKLYCDIEKTLSYSTLLTYAECTDTGATSYITGGVSIFDRTAQNIAPLTYEFVPQAFIKAYIRAMMNPGENVMLVIEEINRGNCAQIFGDMFQLLDRNDDGVSDYAVKPDTDLEQYLIEKLGDKYDAKKGMRLPGNLYIWATMNTSDQSLFPIDSAFKRRWEWKYVPITDAGVGYYIECKGNKYGWYDFISKMNNEIAIKTDSEDKQMGYFFIKAENGKITADRFVNKVLFYLYNDVFKSYDLPTEFGNKKFTAFFTDTDTKVEELMKDLGLKALAETDTAETTEDTAE